MLEDSPQKELRNQMSRHYHAFGTAGYVNYRRLLNSIVFITKTRQCNIQRFFSQVKIENVHHGNIFFYIFLTFAQNIDCGYTLEPPRRGGSNEYPQSMFWSKNNKNRYTPAYPSFAI